MSSAPTFTIFIPTYNRAALLPRALASIEAQTFRDFEVVVVDDGSTDDTEAVVAAWQARTELPVAYRKQANQGKHVAHNTGVGLARGEFFVTLDSDDRLLPDALERLWRHWRDIPAGERDGFAGVEGLVESMDGERILTRRYPRSPLDASYLEVRYAMGIGGDKKGAIRTEILRRFPYPVFSGERHCRDSLIWKRIAHHYRFRYVNEPIQQVEYQPTGLSANCFRMRMSGVRGFQLFYLEDLTLHWPWLSRRQRQRSTVDYIRFSLHSGVGLLRQACQTRFARLWVLMLPMGIVRWLVDLYRLWFRGGAVVNRKLSRN
jgi:glycosyltransferase involved in cell wall biosynthesis